MTRRGRTRLAGAMLLALLGLACGRYGPPIRAPEYRAQPAEPERARPADKPRKEKTAQPETEADGDSEPAQPAFEGEEVSEP